MLKNEEQAIDVIAFLVTQYRKAINHDGDFEPIEKARGAYCYAFTELDLLNEDELHALYLKGKIRADERQLQRHKEELEILEKPEKERLKWRVENAKKNLQNKKGGNL